MNHKKIVARLLNKLHLDDTAVTTMPVNDLCLMIKPAQLQLAVSLLLKAGIWHLSAITCQQIDLDFVLLYHFWDGRGVSLRMAIKENEPVDSITPLIPGAIFYERETREMFGLEFRGLPDPSSLFLPDNWSGGYPLRRTSPAAQTPKAQNSQSKED